MKDLAAAVVDFNKVCGEESAKLQVVNKQFIVAICTPFMKCILAKVSGKKNLIYTNFIRSL